MKENTIDVKNLKQIEEMMRNVNNESVRILAEQAKNALGKAEESIKSGKGVSTIVANR